MTPSTLRATLRSSTSDAHARVDALVGGGFADAAAYRHYLRGMHGFLAASQAALGGDWPLQSLRLQLADDMRMLGVHASPGSRRPALDDDAARLGWAYVVAGASVGARVLVRQAGNLGYDAGSGAGFLHRFARAPMWPAVLSRLEEAGFGPEQAGRCRDAAAAAFASAETAFRRARDEDTDD
jgi:heme oxygenase